MRRLLQAYAALGAIVVGCGGNVVVDGASTGGGGAGGAPGCPSSRPTIGAACAPDDIRCEYPSAAGGCDDFRCNAAAWELAVETINACGSMS